MKDALVTRAPQAAQIGLMLALLSLLVVPHLWHLNPWLAGFFCAAAVWRAIAIARPSILPRHWLLAMLGMLGLLNVVMHAGGVDGRHAGTALLIVMTGLKLLESRTRRDLYVCLLLGFFIALTQFLFDRSLGLAIYLFVLVAASFALLADLSRLQSHWRLSLKMQAGSLLAAMPLTLVLFVLFPRLHTPLWTMKIADSGAVTGIGENMRPGSIGELTQSDAVAFRVHFPDRVPEAAQRYWRGPVLWITDGIEWQMPDAIDSSDVHIRLDLASRVKYEITLEPSGRRWMFPLDVTPESGSDDAHVTADMQMLSRDKVAARKSYSASAFTSYRIETLPTLQRTLGLQLPKRVGTRTREMGGRLARIAAQEGGARAIQTVLSWYREQAFVYSLRPGVLTGDPIEAFLFESRKGYCEHYASSFVMLMRLAGLPSRVVTGYLGGEYNPRGGHWIIRQSDAHAWAEVWLDDRGWVRIDPTAAVAPERIEQRPDVRESGNGAVVFQVLGDDLVRGLWRNVGWFVDAADLGWHRWVLGFTRERQDGVLQRSGLGFIAGYWQPFAMVLVAAGSLTLVWLVGRGIQLRRSDPVQRAWVRLLQKLGHAGIPVAAWQGPERVRALVHRLLPRKALELDRIVDLYIRLRYMNLAGGRKATQELRWRIRRLRLGQR